MSPKLLFASSNKNKFQEAKKILLTLGIELEFFKCDLEEIQSNYPKIIASKKVKEAFFLCKSPVIIEDDGLFIKSLQGFPGPYSSYVFDTIGNKGILHLLKKERTAYFESIIAYCDEKLKPVLFSSRVLGNITKKMEGKGWGYDPIFVPKGYNKTYAKIEKNKISHRYKSLKKFSNWYLGMPVSTCL